MADQATSPAACAVACPENIYGRAGGQWDGSNVSAFNELHIPCTRDVKMAMPFTRIPGHFLAIAGAPPDYIARIGKVINFV